MLKKLIVLLLISVFAISLTAPTVLAAVTEEQQEAIDKLHQRMDELRSQLVDLYLEAGLITEEQAARAREQIELRAERPFRYGCGQGWGWGRGLGRGQGMGGPCLFNAPAPAR